MSEWMRKWVVMSERVCSQSNNLPVFLLMTFSLMLTPETSAAQDSSSLPWIENLAKVPVAKPEKGMLLVGKRGIKDPRFRQTVILLTDHGPQGTLGLIINKPSNIPLSRAVPDLEGIDKDGHSLFFGGPVATNQISFLVRSERPLEVAHVMGDVYFSMSRPLLEQLLQRKKTVHELRVFLGYAGWAPGQLDAELLRGGWYLLPANTQVLFYKNTENIWSELIKHFEPEGLMVQWKKNCVSHHLGKVV